MTTLSLEFTVLLACVRFYLGTTTKSELTCLLASDMNWTTLLQTAINNGVMPVLYQSLKAMEEDVVPRAVMVQLQTLNRMNGLHNVSQTKELLKILTQLEKAGIDAIAFKGAVLAAAAYGNVALRQFNDLDILVRRQNFWQAKAILVSQGYQYSYSERFKNEVYLFECHLQIDMSYEAPEATMFNTRFEPSLLHSNSARSIDLHWGISPRRVWNYKRFERLWENLSPIALMGQQIHTLSPELTLIVQCSNVAKEFSEKRSLKQLCDVAQVIQANPNLNWELVWKLTSELRNQELFLFGLYLTHDLLHIPLSQFILDRFVGLSSFNKQTFEHYGLSANLRGIWFEYMHQRITFDLSSDAIFVILLNLKWILLILLQPNQSDLKFLALPDRLFFLYYFLRPIRLLTHYITKYMSWLVFKPSPLESLHREREARKEIS